MRSSAPCLFKIERGQPPTQKTGQSLSSLTMVDYLQVLYLLWNYAILSLSISPVGFHILVSGTSSRPLSQMSHSTTGSWASTSR